MNKELTVKKIILTLVGFIVFWTIITDAWGYSKFIFNNNIGTYIYGYISRFIWVLPAIFLIVRYNSKLKIKKEELFSKPVFNNSLFITVTVSLSYIVAMMVINHKEFWFNKEIILLPAVIKYIFVGAAEEIVFRGWGYNSLSNVLSHKKAAIITALFFALLHFPAYFIKLLRFGTLDIAGLISQSVSALIWGFVFCWLIKKGNSIWNPITVHTMYDLLFVLFVGGD